MNLDVNTDDYLENLPRREKFQDHSRDCYNPNSDFPWRHFCRFLESCVGRHIDDVIHDYVNADWVPVRERLASKIADVVVMNTFMENGEIYHYGRKYGHGIEKVSELNRYNYIPALYVHPDTRILCKVERVSRKTWCTIQQKERDKVVKILGDYHQLLKLNGIWYEVKAEVDVNTNFIYYTRGPHEILIGDSLYTWYSKDRKPVRITLKRQLNSKELKYHGLYNDFPEKPNTKCKVCGGENCQHTTHQDNPNSTTYYCR